VHELARSCRDAANKGSALLIGVSQALDRVRELQATFHEQKRRESHLEIDARDRG
jgi:hypothetical protein